MPQLKKPFCQQRKSADAIPSSTTSQDKDAATDLGPVLSAPIMNKIDEWLVDSIENRIDPNQFGVYQSL